MQAFTRTAQSTTAMSSSDLRSSLLLALGLLLLLTVDYSGAAENKELIKPVEEFYFRIKIDRDCENSYKGMDTSIEEKLYYAHGFYLSLVSGKLLDAQTIEVFDISPEFDFSRHPAEFASGDVPALYEFENDKTFCRSDNKSACGGNSLNFLLFESVDGSMFNFKYESIDIITPVQESPIQFVTEKAVCRCALFATSGCFDGQYVPEKKALLFDKNGPLGFITHGMDKVRTGKDVKLSFKQYEVGAVGVNECNRRPDCKKKM